MSLQVWCYECDKFVEGWDIIDYIQSQTDVSADVNMSMSGSVDFISSNSGAGKQSNSTSTVSLN